MIREYPEHEIWTPQGLHKVHIQQTFDASPAMESNHARKQEVGRGFWNNKEGKEECEIPSWLFFRDADCIEWYRTGSQAAKKRFIAKYPWVRCSEGGV